MRIPMNVLVLAVALMASTGCGGPAAEVRTAPTPAPGAAEQSVQVTNNLSQAVNVYVASAGGGELFLRQVPANTVEKVPVQGIAIGAMVTFKAVTMDGSRTYQSRIVALRGTYPWSLP